MLTKEDFQMLSNLLDAKIDPLRDDMNARMAKLEARMDALEKRVGALEARMDKLEARVAALEARMDSLEKRVGELEKRVGELGKEVGKLKTDFHHFQLLLENDIRPRMQNIESCYVSTYENYTAKADQIAGLQANMQLLKGVAAEHGSQLQHLADAM